MTYGKNIFNGFIILFFLFCSPLFAASTTEVSIPIICYHNLTPKGPGNINLKPETFESQIKWLIDNGYHIIPLKQAVAYLRGETNSLPTKPVVITADDGWESDFTYMMPVAQKYHIPITLFIYPATISSGKHSLTWEQLKQLQQTGLFDIQGHTYWHPNFKHEKKKRSPADYEKFVIQQLAYSKQLLENKLGTKVTLLAWPYGIYNSYLEAQAAKAGYVMAFSIDDAKATRKYAAMAQPRFMMIQERPIQAILKQ